MIPQLCIYFKLEINWKFSISSFPDGSYVWCWFCSLFFVPVPPNIAGTGGPQELTVLQNSQAILECRSDAVPPPTISWLKNGELLQVLSLQPLSGPLLAAVVTAVLQVSCSARSPLSPSSVPAAQSSWVAPVPLQPAPGSPQSQRACEVAIPLLLVLFSFRGIPCSSWILWAMLEAFGKLLNGFPGKVAETRLHSLFPLAILCILLL